MTDVTAVPQDGAGAGTPAGEHLQLDGGRVHFFRAGKGEPLLFLHAAGGAGTWLEFHRLLARQFDVIAPDHPGFGGSGEFADVEAIDDLVYHYLDVMDGLGLDRPHVAGASFGGWIAAELAVAAPHRVASVVLMSPAGLRLPGHPVADLFLMTPEQLVTALYHEPAAAGRGAPAEPDLDFVLAQYRDLTALARFGWTPFLSNPKLERRLHRVTAPTLVIAPADDRLIPLAHARRYAERIPGARYAEIGDCGHAMHFERPAEFADVTAGFLNEHRLADTGQPNGASR
ncbi:MAG TPA: alpha/beta fold hydrolase [Streptosporangiaceae bacterium]|nr:alpha/beta fold hydrolase [Streptosporangiaceae bacterium]